MMARSAWDGHKESPQPGLYGVLWQDSNNCTWQRLQIAVADLVRVKVGKGEGSIFPLRHSATVQLINQLA